MTRSAICMLLLVGCASPIKSVKDDNRRLDREVTELRAERRAQDRKMRDLQHQLDKIRADRATAIAPQMPVLPVEVAAPPPGTMADAGQGETLSRVVAITEDGTEIVYEGDAAAGKSATWGDEPAAPAPSSRRAATPRRHAQPAGTIEFGSHDSLGVTTSVARSSARSSRAAMRDRDSMPSERSSDASTDYRAAVELVRSGDSTAAVPALRAFLSKYPRHDYADNAQYWLGEAFYAQKDYRHALAEFRNVIETYPRGNKVPDALLKVGFCYAALGETEKSRAVLEQVVNLYPKSEPAVLAAKRLDGGVR